MGKIKLAPKKKTKGKKRTQPETSTGHRERFNQLFDDAVLGVKKK
jgi:hypothetical protein